MKIICIGRNYVDHAKELDNPVPEEPIYFMKPDCALLPNNKPFYLPEFSKDVQYECELVVKINRLGKHIEKKFAHLIPKRHRSDLVDWVSEGTLSLVRGSSSIKVVGKVGIVSVRSVLCSRTSVFLY